MILSIRTKLIGVFTLILVLLVSTSILMIRKLSETNDSLDKVVDVSSQKVILSDDIMISLLQTTRHEKNIILERDPSKRENYRMLVNQAISDVNSKLPELQRLVDIEGNQILSKFTLIWDKYQQNVNKVITLAYQDRKDEAYELSSNLNYEARNKSINLLKQLVDKNKQDMIADKEISDISYKSALNMIILLITFCIVIALLSAYWIIRSISRRISTITEEADKIASREHSDAVITADVNDELQPVIASLISINESFKEVTQHAARVASGNYSDNIAPKSEKDTLGKALHKMTVSLKETTAENEKHNWLSTGLNKMSETLRGDKEVEVLATDTVSFLCEYLKANVGAIYLAESNVLQFAGGYAVTISSKKQTVKFKEGLLGQAAESKKPIYINGLHEEALVINSATVNKKPDHLMVVPFEFEGKTMGVVEIGSLTPFSETDKEFVESCLESISISLNSAIARKKIQMLLEETQVQSEELQSQQEELRQMNEELEEQTQGLKQQQEELQIANEELEEQTQTLEMKNKELEFAKHDIEEKRRQIEISSKYKSEFLANMSHELRTPLNSLLILSKDLSENRNNNLTSDQVECAEIIYNSGHDLLNLINEVLDLSKIEAGKMTLQIEKTYLQELADTTYKNFKHQADKKKLGFKINIDKAAPEYILTDRLRLDQIIKNLISNAIKFTDKGEVVVSIKKETENTISIAVKDTGIGIPEDKQQYIFEAFQQADGGTSRKYGGTGLGLSISRELVKLLNADMKLESKQGTGSTFTLTLPLELVQEDEIIEEVQQKSTGKQKAVTLTDSVVIPDDRYQINEEDNIVLIIEDDLNFAKILLKQAQQKGFKGIVAATGETGLLLAEEHRPHAIIMDMNLPGIKGDKVIKELKKDPLLKHIPVHIISGEDRSLEMINNGAIEYLTKPIEKDQLEEAFNRIENVIDRKMKNVLIIEADKASRANISGLIAGGEVKCIEAQTGKEAIKTYSKNHIDCIVLDLDLADMSGIKLIYELEKVKPDAMPPVVVYTGRLLTKEENDELLKCTETVIIKGAKSEERLLNETALFLHRTISTMPESRNKKTSNIQDKDALFKSKKVLLVDDDMRNVFALSKILKERGLEIVKAENGYSALNALDIDPSVDIVLMDIMMPEMDGYETMQKIRRQAKFKNLPIIALTAKAMKEDRQKCIDAGANDYITKPVDVERLLSLMRVWLSK
jgi:signal transduction histidine kinase/CheY-like chemotaxis protein/putative methionine-R-sulfoxide reductase with GAF domain